MAQNLNLQRRKQLEKKRRTRDCWEQCGERARTAYILDLTSNNEENKVRIVIFEPRIAGEIYAAK